MGNIYVTYEKYKRKYYEIQKLYDKILEEKERLFSMTQPKSTKFNKINIDGGKNNNTFDDYLIMKEKKKLDGKLEEIKIILSDRKKLLEEKEKELRNSKEWIDKVYVYKYLENIKVRKIIHLIPYEEAQIYRMLNEIKQNFIREINIKEKNK